MARVVQQRSTGAPYLLITMVFLFLMASAIAGIFYNKNSDNAKDLKEALASRDDVISPQVMDSEDYKTWLAAAREHKITVVDLLDRRIKNLSKAIAEGEKASAESLVKKADDEWDRYEKALRDRENALEAKWKKNSEGGPASTYDTRGKAVIARRTGAAPPPPTGGPQETLLAVIGMLDVELADANKELEGIDQQLVNKEKDYSQLTEDLQTAKDGYAKDIAGEAAKVTAKQTELDDRNTQYEESVAAIQRTKDAEIKEKEKELNELDVKIDGLEGVKRKQTDKIAVQAEKIRVLEGKGKGDEGEAVLAADARVLRVSPDDDVVYIDIGSVDRVRRGLRFTVFGNRKGVNLASQGKAKIVITSVGASTAECRITEADSSDPIIAGDLVSNLAFDATIPPLFVLEGPFDLDGDNVIDARGKERLKTLIDRYGGRLSEQVAPNVDYVVMGEPPSLPGPEPAAGHPPVQQAIWDQKVREFKHYDQVKAAATEMRKPILSVRQFLTLIGYVAGQED